MRRLPSITLNLIMLGVLSACANSNSNGNSNATQNTQPNTPSNQTMDDTALPNPNLAQLKLTQIDLTAIGLAKQLTTHNDKLLIVNDKNELWQWGESSALARNVSNKIAPAIGFDKLAFADTNGYFHLIQNGKTYPSNIRLSPHSKMLILPLAVIAVADDNGTPSLVRLEVVGDNVQVVAKFAPVLPDARPVQINFTGDNANGHIAILSHPDSTTYQHGVLGDGVEAGQLQFLERHRLTPVAKPLMIDGQVFEANTVVILPHDKGNYLVATMAGGGNGAKTVVIDNVNGALQVIAQSTPLPSNRWQSPFVFNGNLYAVQMPHLVGKLVRYDWQDNQLTATEIGQGYSNHKIGSYETNLTTTSNNSKHGVIVPMAGYQTLSLISKTGKVAMLDAKLPSPIIKGLNGHSRMFYLLENGQVWAANHQ